MLSFFWNVDQAYDTLTELAIHKEEGNAPNPADAQKLQEMYSQAGLSLSTDATIALISLGIKAS